MVELDRTREAGAWQAALCERLESPTWAAVIRSLLADLGRDTAASALLLEDGADPSTSMLWLRLLGAVHRLVLDDVTCEIADCFPTAGGRSHPARAAREVPLFIEERADEIRVEMRQPVQTNEVGRAAALSAAMNWLGGDLVLLELGTSAGLNLWLDRYRVTTAAAVWGPLDAQLVLDDAFVSGEPPPGPFAVRGRRGCDREPLDLTSASDRRLLRSFVWPDHAERLRRLDAAVATGGRAPIDVSECVSWTCRQLQALEPGRTVVYHSLVLPYLTRAEEAELEAVIEEAGRRADEAHALAWVTLEPFAAEAPDVELVVRRWPERDAHRLALLAPHGGKIRWEPQPLEGPRAPTPRASARA